MSETNQAESGLGHLRRWREDYRGSLKPAALQDVSQLAAQLDMTHAHPTGIAQLFASGHARLDSLFRDPGMLRAAGRRLERVLDDRETKARLHGVADLSLVVGIASWRGNSVPVLLYPVQIVLAPDSKETEAVVRFTGTVQLNPVFKSMMSEQGIVLNEDELFDGSNYESGTPDTSAVFSAIKVAAISVFRDFDIERNIVLGCFMDPSTQLLAESQNIIDSLEQGASGIVPLDALAGDARAQKALRGGDLPEYSPFDDDPHNEYEVGDVSNEMRYAANLVANGRSLFINVGFGENTALDAASITSRCISSERSVLYVPCVASQMRHFTRVMDSYGLNSRLLDMASPTMVKDLDSQLISAVGFQPGIATSHFDQLSDELVGVRSRLTRYLGDLHGVSEEWGVSAYQTIQNLASISTLETHPATRVRLSKQTARTIAEDMDGWAEKLSRAGEFGEYTIGPGDTPWYKASIYSKAEADDAYYCVENLLQKLLPSTRSQVASTVEACGFPVPKTVEEWSSQVGVLKNLRRVLDVFQPEVFERDLDSMIEATKPKAERKADGSGMGFLERRRYIKEARKLLRTGAQVENLHDALLVVERQALQWHDLAPHGGWPVLPPRLDTIIETQEALLGGVTALNAVLATTPQGGNLESTDLARLEERLKALYSDRMALDMLPGRARLEREFSKVGLDELIADLHARHVEIDAVEGELELSWWTTVFEDIVRSSAIISNQDGSALESAAVRFCQVDTEHVHSIGSMIEQESTRRLSDLLFSRTQEANQLHTVLASKSRVSLGRIRREHPEIFAAAKPVIVATPSTLAAMSSPEPLADVAIVDAGAHMSSISLLSIVSRARQVVVLAHRDTVTSDSLKTLIDMLPSVELKPVPTRVDPRLTTFLAAHGYGPVGHDVAVERMQGRVRFHRVEANGVPVLSTGLIESSQQEIDRVISIIKERASSFKVVPADYALAVVSITPVFKSRLGVELKSLAAKDRTMARFLRHVRLVGIDEVSGARATDVILSFCFAKTAHGRLLQQFGSLEGDGGDGKLLDALALTDRDLDIVAAFGSEDMEDERLHQVGPRLLKVVLEWAEGLGGAFIRPEVAQDADDVLFSDLASRIRSRGLRVAINYGFEGGTRIPLVVGLKDKPFSLAVLTDDADFMGVQSTRRRHRIIPEELRSLGWSVMTVWGVGAFVNPDKEVDRVVSRIGEIYKEGR